MRNPVPLKGSRGGETAMHSPTSDCLVDLIDSEAEAEINEKKQTETKSGI